MTQTSWAKGRIIRSELRPGDPLTAKQLATLERLRNMSDDDIDLSDMPEWTSEMFATAERGKFYRPVKEPVTVRIDSDVVHWLKSQGRGYQTRLNTHLREWMLSELSASKKKPARKSAKSAATTKTKRATART